MDKRVVPKIINSCVAYMDGVLSVAHEVLWPEGLTRVPRLELNGPTLRHFESQSDSLRIN